MPFPHPTATKSAAAAQEFLPIEAIRDGVVMLKRGQELRSVLMVSSLNFALKSEEEQDALVYQYENFLNALDFPLEFVISSRRLNIHPYLEMLAEREREETNELLKVQIGEYAEFVKSFVELTNIVSKTFFAVVPFTPSVVERRGGLLKGLGALLGGRRAEARPSVASGPGAGGADGLFEQFKNQLQQRVDATMSGLRRLGLRAQPLGTEELVELFYGLYNPSEGERIRNAEHAPPTP